MKIKHMLFAAAGIFLLSPVFAQTGKVIKTAFGGVERSVRSAVMAAPKISVRARVALPDVRGFSLSSATVERYVFKQLPQLTPFPRLQFNPEEPPYAWMKEKYRQYEEVVASFKDFKKEADVFLYYQSKPSERRTVHPEEISYWREKIDDMESRLVDLCWNVSSDDPVLSAALEYMAYAKWSVYPHAKDIYFAKPLPPRTDRTFKAEEFFLHDPFPVSSKRWETAFGRAKRIAKELPPGLRVAVVNDIHFYRQHLEELSEKGVLFPDGNLSVFPNADELLKAVFSGRKKFDVVFTDIIIAGNGGGGYYLASELRRRGYAGSIIGLSSYAEDAALGERMFERGLDGMIPMDGGKLYKKDWPAYMMQKLRNYFYYRDMYGWDY